MKIPRDNRRTAHWLPVRILALAGLLVTLASHATAGTMEGKYKGAQATGRGSYSIELELKRGGDAEMVLRPSSDLRTNSDNIAKYGDVIQFFDEYDLVKLSGDWEMEGRDLVVRFDHAWLSRDVQQRFRATLDFSVSGNKITLEDAPEDRFGTRSGFVLTKSNSNSTANAVAAGAAIVALGAVIANNTKSGTSSDPYGRNYSYGSSGFNYDSGGNGFGSIVGGAHLEFEEVRVNVQSGGRFNIGFKQSIGGAKDTWVSGTWRRLDRNRYQLTVTDISIDGWRGGTGTGTIYMRTDREVASLNVNGRLRQSGKNVSFSFSTARG